MALKRSSSLQAGEGTEAEQQPIAEKNLQIPKEIIQRLRNVIFGFDFFVTSVEDYQANGIIFKGNLRGDPATAYDRIGARLRVRTISVVKNSMPPALLCMPAFSRYSLRQHYDNLHLLLILL